MFKGHVAELFQRNLFLCPVVSILLAAGVLTIFGVTVWTALLTALLLVCPATMIWGAFTVAHRPGQPGQGAPQSCCDEQSDVHAADRGQEGKSPSVSST